MLTDTQRKLILHWGEMGTKWGINRTVAQIHALLYLSPEPIHAEEIAATLQIARSNVSMSLKELQSWGIVRVEQRLGDRRDYFTTLDDIWEMFRRILAERKKREIDPTLTMLRQCAMEAQEDGDAATAEKIAPMLDFMEQMTAAYEQLDRMPTATLRRLAQMSERLNRFLIDLAGK
ncbi:MAG: MarR family transcriptional regulator [Sumerlaeia bacterium]